MNDNRDSIDFGADNIRRLFSSIFFPTLFGMLFSMAFVFTDGIFVGHGVGDYGLASVNLVAPIMMFINGLGMMFGVGVSVVAAIHLSQINRKAARINVSQAFAMGVIISLIMALVCYLFPDTILHLLGVDDSLVAPVREYYLWFIPCCLLMMIECIGLFVIRLDGSPRYAMMANIIPAIVNAVMDYVLIFPCGMGLKGAALATDFGGLVGTGMVVYYMVFRAKTLNLYPLKFTRTSNTLMVRNVRYMIRVGLSAFVGEFAVAVMMLTGNWMFMGYLGPNGVAAYSVVCYLFPLVYMIYCAVTQSAQPIISFNHGAGNNERVRKIFRFSLLVSLLAGFVLTAVFIFFAPTVVSAFLESGVNAHSLAVDGLPIYAAMCVFMAINLSYIGYYQSTEQNRAALVFSLLRGVFFVVLSFILLPLWFGIVGLWMAMPVAEALTTICVLLYNLWHYRKK